MCIMHENLWAPWRMKYIEQTPDSKGNKATGDIFIDLPAEGDDRKNLILFRGTTAFILMNAYPYTNGHLMVAPYRQTADISDMTDDELLEVNQHVASAVRWLREVYRPDGFNIGVNMGSAAGAGIPIHIHWHIVPRWNGDTNFMTTIGEVRVMPQTLDDSYNKLRAASGQ
jgi:ATP adenylyltransferase